MFEKLKMKFARKHEAKKIKQLFLAIDPYKNTTAIETLIADRQVIVFKKRKKIKAAIAFVVINIIGIFTLMYIKKIAVDKSHQGKGMGTFLLQKIQKLTKLKNIHFTFLYSVEKAVNFYKKNKLANCWRFFWWK